MRGLRDENQTKATKEKEAEMNNAQAVKQVLTEAERANEFISSLECAKRAERLVLASLAVRSKMSEYDSLSELPILGQLKYRVPKTPTERMKEATAAEFLGEEFWTSLTTFAQRDAVREAYNRIRAIICGEWS